MDLEKTELGTNDTSERLTWQCFKHDDGVGADLFRINGYPVVLKKRNKLKQMKENPLGIASRRKKN